MSADQANPPEPSNALGPNRRRAVRVMIGLILFGISFGYVEAAIVVYLRVIYDPLRQAIHPDKPEDELFPMITLEELKAADPLHMRRLATELGREAATLAMLAAVAVLASRNLREWTAAFGLAFGVWDIFYYVFLKVLIDWPASLMTWDILFLLPVPWVGPVLSPVIVAAAMIACGTWLIWREHLGRPVRVRAYHAMGITLGAIVLIVAFCWDYRNTSAGGWPNPFHWPLFGVGLAIGLAAFLHAMLSRPRSATAQR